MKTSKKALFGGLDLNLPVLPRGAIRKLPKAITGTAIGLRLPMRESNRTCHAVVDDA